MTDPLRKLGLVPYFTQQLSDVALMEARLGRVTAVHRSRITVITAQGEQTVELSPSLQQLAAIERPTVGDWVVLNQALLRIESVLERKSLFKRVGSGTNNDMQPIAANIDTLFIVTSCNEEFKESRIERYLTLCREAGAMSVIILTKIDLAEDPDSFVERARKTQAGVPVEAVNALEPASIQALSAWIDRNATVALVGSSGVGKSTLLNTLAGHTLSLTGGIREDDKKGRHTTTHRQLHVLPSGGLLIDVPGMRELKVGNISDSIDTIFDDIGALAAQCKFADCQHESEPNCAVARAIENGQLDPRRLSNYKKLLRENTITTASMAEKRARGRDLAKMVKEAKTLKQNKGKFG